MRPYRDPKLSALRTVAGLLAIIALCQVIQTVQYVLTPAQASPPAIPVIIDGISSRVSSGSHALPVVVREPIRMGQ